MLKNNHLVWGGLGFLIVGSSILFVRPFIIFPHPSTKSSQRDPTPVGVPTPSSQPIIFHGPRYGATDVPKEYGFWSFAVVSPGKLSRSGQPNAVDFEYLHKAGYTVVINLRTPGEYNEETDDQVIATPAYRGFRSVELPMPDGGIPTTDQAQTFLREVHNSSGPVHVHCRGGIGRTGVMIALYRYEVDGWPMQKAIEESRLFRGGVNGPQREWLLAWEKEHPNGE